jgi:hypothetical protein
MPPPPSELKACDFSPEDRDNMCLQNVGVYLNVRTVLQPRRLHWRFKLPENIISHDRILYNLFGDFITINLNTSVLVLLTHLLLPQM